MLMTATNQFTKRNTIQFYIDSILFKDVNYWDLEIKFPKQKDTLIRFSKTYYPYIQRRKS